MKYFILILTVLFNSVFSAFSQKQISGAVFSSEGNMPLIGATIVEKNTTNGTSTDLDGKFMLQISDTSTFIVASFIGFQSVELHAIAKEPMVIMLQPESEAIEEVVVTVPYSQQRKGSFTGALGVLSPKKLNEIPNISVDKALQGKISGIQINSNSGEPGGATEVKIRGMGSISASSSPLYVLDGIPIESENLAQLYSSGNILSTLNSSDIESISVLKDAAAASLYGSRASNGVIMITTKKGKSGNTAYSFNTAQGFSMVSSNGYKVLNTQEYLTLKKEAMLNAGYSEYEIITELPSDEENTNWMEQVFENAYSQSYSLGVSGGNEQSSFYASSSYENQNGVVLGTGLQKMTARLNAEHKASSKLTLGAKLMAARLQKNTTHGAGSIADPVTGAYILSPTTPVYHDDETFYFTNNTQNVVGTSALDVNQQGTLRLLSQVYGSYIISDDITFKTLLASDYIFLEEEKYQHPFTPDGKAKNGVGYYYTTKHSTITSSSTIEYKKIVAKDHTSTVLGGFELQDANNEFTQAIASNFATTEYVGLSSAAQRDALSSYSSPWAIMSFFGSGKYNFKQKYYLSASIRRDGSSRFAKNKWGNFWSAGLLWRLSEESFMQNISWLNSLKFRASYGTSGNSAIGNDVAYAYYKFDDSYNDEPAAYRSNIGNEDITWEKNNNADIGTDFRVLKRFTGTVELYHRRTWDLLLEAPISMTNGFDHQIQNIGEMLNKGVEVGISTINIDKKIFKWKTDITFSKNRNEVLTLYNGEEIISGSKIHKEGLPYNTFYIKNWAGVNPADGIPLWYDAEGNITKEYSKAGYVEAGCSDPDFIAGVSNALNVGMFEFSFFIYINYGNMVYNNMNEYLLSDGAQTSMNQSAKALDRWQMEGDITNVPKVIHNNPSGGNSTSTRFLEDGSFLRLKSVNLSYTFRESVCSKLNLKNCRIFLQGTNLYTLTNYSGMDPEKNFVGLAFFSYPNVKQFNAGISVGF